MLAGKVDQGRGSHFSLCHMNMPPQCPEAVRARPVPCTSPTCLALGPCRGFGEWVTFPEISLRPWESIKGTVLNRSVRPMSGSPAHQPVISARFDTKQRVHYIGLAHPDLGQLAINGPRSGCHINQYRLKRRVWEQQPQLTADDVSLSVCSLGAVSEVAAAGVIGTGTHNTGIKHGILPTQVRPGAGGTRAGWGTRMLLGEKFQNRFG